METTLANRLKSILLVIALGTLGLGVIAYMSGRQQTANLIWMAGVLPVLVALLIEIVRSLWLGEVGLDIVAALSMSAALVFGEALAAAIVAVMYSGGTFLESFAEGRARREMRHLLSRVPRTATRHSNGALEEVPLDAVRPGDRLLIRQGDVVPVDGTALSERAYVDTSALTGESLPLQIARNGDIMSGSTNAGEAFDLHATRGAAQSTYAGIVRLVEAAQRSKAPMSRMADRWSLGFLAITVVLAAAAWLATGDPVRAVAVLVVATPCPLILAVPVALVAGLSRAAHFGVLIKGARPLEAMADVETIVLDKTGTLTDGRPHISGMQSAIALSDDQLLRMAAALDQASQHPIARALVSAARSRGLILPIPLKVTEIPGEGVTGEVDGLLVAVGGVGFVERQLGVSLDLHPNTTAGSVIVSVAIGGQFAGHIVMADPLRTDAAEMLDALRKQGVSRLLLATGDRAEVADHIVHGLHFDGVRANLSPDQKVLLVLSERKNGPVMMVGDGINDAPALAAADVGVAMGARGAAASAEAADVVLLVDSIDRVAIGISIARQSRRIAIQSVVVGLGLSLAGMVAAAFGFLSPVQGAFLQEAIDVAVIVNALRALRIEPPQPRSKPRSASIIRDVMP